MKRKARDPPESGLLTQGKALELGVSVPRSPVKERGLCFSLVFPLWELCCSLVLPIDGTGSGNAFGGGGMLRGNIFKSRFLHYSSPPLFSLYLSFSLSLSCGFCLDWVLTDRDLMGCRELLM